ncbi:ATP-dependent RNA helicase DEAH11, chloroplastic-like [Magnolia sinica]|uniref:ATP-dependent RNA helicase DEAH11, chloroplastic-like n=1 Tax=Magnolia sinica TaxID=86752 RepID=UPI002659A086|nr:ATP-dependent RNA helicase DEAH11, chloroplastic-like [Magnolia sinica]
MEGVKQKMRRQLWIPTRPNFAVELHSGLRSFSKSDLDTLISGCPSLPDHSVFLPSGPVAARLFFRQWHDALDAVAFFWARCLDGSHHLTPTVRSMLSVPSDSDELASRLKELFAARARDLLESESVHRWRKKIERLTEEIIQISTALRNLNHVEVFTSRQQKKRGLVAEREQIEKRLEEFKAAMYCILVQLDGTRWEEEELEVFGFGGDLDWERIHHVMARECRRLDEGLPIYSYRQEILRQIHCRQVMILIGETGCGKSTQLVQFLADSSLATSGSIICTQPRKIAVMSLAQRIREESNGCYAANSVSYFGSYSSVQRLDSKVIFMTDHCLLQHFMNGTNLDSISYIIVDEAHERSLNTDLLLALVKKLLLQRLDLRLIIMSATADASQLSDYFFGCGTFLVKGRNFTVDVEYVPNAYAGSSWAAITENKLGSCPSYVSDVVKMVAEIHRTEEDGAILVFLTSQSEVEWACEKFQTPSAVALPLHGKLSCEEQRRAFQNYQGKRKVIFATNLAETSLTIPDIKYVVDSGMVKESRFEPSTGMNVLRVSRISQSSACQRAGRAGRTGPGKCYRLYSECDFQSMLCYLEPEIRRVHLGIAVLRILSLGIEDVRDFDFVDAPSPEAINMAIRNLIQLGAVIYKNGILELTDIGRPLVRLGVEPRLGKIILESLHYRLGREGLVLAAVMANASSIFCRVGNDEEKSKSDCLKVQFCHRDGDLFTLLSVYKEWDDEPQESKNKWCWKNSINAKSMRRCKDTILELEHCLQHELQIIVPSHWKWNQHVPTVYDKLLKKVIISSSAENVAVYSGYSRLGYEVALTGQHVQLHPSCSLLIYGHNPSWVVFGELLSISKQYLVCVTGIDYECLLTLQPPLPFDVAQLDSRKMQMNVITGVGGNLLRRFCGKSNNSLHRLISRIQTDCMDCRIGIDLDFNKREVHLFASSKDMPEVSSIVNEALEHEKEWLRDECIEKCLFRGGPNFSPPVALFGAGADIKHLELEKRYLTVEVFHSNANLLENKELLMLFGKSASGIANFHKYAGMGQSGDSERWGKITFLAPESAEAAVKLNGIELHGSLLKVFPSWASFGCDDKTLPFPAVRAKVSWPRRHSKGVAVVRCARQDVTLILKECSTMVIGGRFVRCEISKKYEDCFVICRLGREITEQEISDALRNATNRRIIDVFLLRGEAVNQPSGIACEDALLREIAPFMPSKNCPQNHCRVQVFPPDPKDYSMKALISFDGSLHLEAAKAFQHLEGKVLPGCLPWQKIQCEQIFHSFVSCPTPVYHVIKKELDILFDSFNRRKGLSYNLDRTNNGSYRVKISSNATKTMAEVRKPLEQLMKGKTITHANLTPNVLQLLFSPEGIGLMKRLERETGTYILHDKQNLNIRVFGPPKEVATAEQKLVQSLLQLHESKQLKIHLRGSNLPPNLMKEVVGRFGADLHGLKEKVPGADFVLDTRRHVLSIQGSKELKQKVEEIVFKMAQSPCHGPSELSKAEDTCPICFCEVEDCYRLEACGHGFCYMCLVDQCESAMKNRDGFPLHCACEGCKSHILLVDLRCLLSSDKLEELFRASLGAFVASSGGVYRFCPSPDCPSVYRVADPHMVVEQPPFTCGACFVETCTKCHLEYHPSVSCERYREFKEDPDASLTEWRKGKDHVKNCPICGYTIEKVDGCNHMACNCGKHICWVCLQCFDSSGECYGHLRMHDIQLDEA